MVLKLLGKFSDLSTSGAEVDSENICKIRRKYLFKLI